MSAGDFVLHLLVLLWTAHVHGDQMPALPEPPRESVSLTTEQVFGKPPPGYLAAFADLNRDRVTDILVISDLQSSSGGGSRLDGYLLKGPSSSSLTGGNLGYAVKKTLLSVTSGSILAVTPTDLDGDAVLDLLLSVKHGASISVQVSWGKVEGETTTYETPVPVATMMSQPALVDWNGDQIGDLLGETKSGKRVVFLGSTYKNFTRIDAFSGSQAPLTLTPSTSHAFADLDGDLRSDILLTVKNSGDTWAELWTAKSEFKSKVDISLPEKAKSAKIIGQATLADLDSDDFTEVLLPVCMDVACKDSKLFIWSSQKPAEWREAFIKWEVKSLRGFAPPESDPLNKLMGRGLSLALRTGDGNSDGHVDLVTVVKDAKGNNRLAVLWNQGSDKFRPSAYGPDLVGVSQAAWFDHDEDGVLDVLATRVVNGHAQVEALSRSRLSDEGYFLKVMILSGRCADKSSCRLGELPYGLPIAGPVAKYKTERPDGGGYQRSRASQLTQTVYNALQLPCIYFGLGQYANYLEKLETSVPWMTASDRATVRRVRTFNFIVPNSQMVVIPSPMDKPEQWKNKLFVRPIFDKQVLYVGAALLGTCGLVAGILGLLQWREVRQDRLEKLQEAQKFHFDAM